MRYEPTQIMFDISQVLAIILSASTLKTYLELMKKQKKNKHLIQLNVLIDQLPFHDMYFLPYRDQVSFLGQQ